MTQPVQTIKKPRGKARLIAGKCIACGTRCQAVWDEWDERGCFRADTTKGPKHYGQ